MGVSESTHHANAGRYLPEREQVAHKARHQTTPQNFIRLKPTAARGPAGSSIAKMYLRLPLPFKIHATRAIPKFTTEFRMCSSLLPGKPFSEMSRNRPPRSPFPTVEQTRLQVSVIGESIEISRRRGCPLVQKSGPQSFSRNEPSPAESNATRAGAPRLEQDFCFHCRRSSTSDGLGVFRGGVWELQTIRG